MHVICPSFVCHKSHAAYIWTLGWTPRYKKKRLQRSYSFTFILDLVGEVLLPSYIFRSSSMRSTVNSCLVRWRGCVACWRKILLRGERYGSTSGRGLFSGGGSSSGEGTDQILVLTVRWVGFHQCRRRQRHLGGGMAWWPATSDHELTNLLKKYGVTWGSTRANFLQGIVLDNQIEDWRSFSGWIRVI